MHARQTDLERLCTTMKDPLQLIEKAISIRLTSVTAPAASVTEARHGLNQHAPSQHGKITESKSDKGKGVVYTNEPDNEQDKTIVLGGVTMTRCNHSPLALASLLTYQLVGMITIISSISCRAKLPQYP